MHFREPIDYSDPSASGTLVAVGQGLNDAHPDCEPEWVCSGEHLSASLSVCDCRARKLLTESIFYHMRGGQGEVFVIRRADYFGLTVACILSSLRTIYRTAANEGSSTGLPFCPVSLAFLPRACRDLRTTSCASGAEVVVGPSASNTPILHF
jgi:hypothetical protein